MTQATPAPRGEGVASPVELVVVTRREFYKWLDRLTAEVKAAEDKLLGCVPDEKAAEDKLLGCVPNDRLIAELRRRDYQITYRKIRDHQEAAPAEAPVAARAVEQLPLVERLTDRAMPVPPTRAGAYGYAGAPREMSGFAKPENRGDVGRSAPERSWWRPLRDWPPGMHFEDVSATELALVVAPGRTSQRDQDARARRFEQTPPGRNVP
jgi:hypothetical protein